MRRGLIGLSLWLIVLMVWTQVGLTADRPALSMAPLTGRGFWELTPCLLSALINTSSPPAPRCFALPIIRTSSQKNEFPESGKICSILINYYRGKFVVVTCLQAFTGLYPHWGKKKTLDHCRALVGNDPIWMSSFDVTIAGIAAGEFPIIVGANVTDILGFLEPDPIAKLKMAIPTEVPVNAYFHTIIPKEAKYPNAGLLLAGWFAAPEGQKMFDTVVRWGSPMVEGTEMAQILEASEARIYYNS